MENTNCTMKSRLTSLGRIAIIVLTSMGLVVTQSTIAAPMAGVSDRPTIQDESDTDETDESNTEEDTDTSDASDDSESVSSDSLQLLIPLYIYPSWWDTDSYQWDDIADAADRADITVIINPNNGPDGGEPNSDYSVGLDDLRDAGVTILGYVYTSYGQRDSEDVQTDIDLYDAYYDIDGIFFDETANDEDNLSYYQELYSYVTEQTALETVVINPGTSTIESYLNGDTVAADTAVTAENTYDAWLDWPDQASWTSEMDSEAFSVMVYDCPDEDSMEAAIDLAVSRNYGYIYITDDNGDNPWDSLPSYWSELIDYTEAFNSATAE